MSPLITPYRNFVWPKEGEVKVKEFTIKKAGCVYGIKPNKEYGIIGSRLNINQGLHAELVKKEAYYHLENGGVTKEMIIPKGTKYIKGKDGNIVALCMRLAKPEKDVRSKRKSTKGSKRKVVSKRKKK